jgi:hypothetical protein
MQCHPVREFKAYHNPWLLGNGRVFGGRGGGKHHKTLGKDPHLVGILVESVFLHKHGLWMNARMGKRRMAPINIVLQRTEGRAIPFPRPLQPRVLRKCGQTGSVGGLAGRGAHPEPNIAIRIERSNPVTWKRWLKRRATGSPEPQPTSSTCAPSGRRCKSSGNTCAASEVSGRTGRVAAIAS